MDKVMQSVVIVGLLTLLGLVLVGLKALFSRPKETVQNHVYLGTPQAAPIAQTSGFGSVIGGVIVSGIVAVIVVMLVLVALDNEKKSRAASRPNNAVSVQTPRGVERARQETVNSVELRMNRGQASYLGNMVLTDPLYRGTIHQLFTFLMQEGFTYQIDMRSEALDSYLCLEGPAGNLLAQDDDGGGYPHARIIHNAAQTGRHRIIATQFGQAKAGEFLLTIRQIDPAP